MTQYRRTSLPHTTFNSAVGRWRKLKDCRRQRNLFGSRRSPTWVPNDAWNLTSRLQSPKPGFVRCIDVGEMWR